MYHLLNINKSHQTRKFSCGFHSHKILSYTSPYPFISLKPEKGTPSGRSLTMKAMIGSTPRHIPEQPKYEILCLQVRASHYPRYCLQVSYFHAQQQLAFLHILNALLVTAVHVKMKLGDNTLNSERLSIVNTKFLTKYQRIVALILLPYNTSILLKLKGYKKGRLILRILNF